MSKKESVAKSIKQFAVQAELLLESVAEYKSVLDKMTQQEIRSFFTSAEIQFFGHAKWFAKNLHDALNGHIDTICVYEKSINITTLYKRNKKVADIPAMMQVLQTADTMVKELAQQGYEVYSLLTDGGQILKVYKKEKEEETVAKLEYAFKALHQQAEPISNTVFAKINELKNKQLVILQLKAQAEALGIKVSFA